MLVSSYRACDTVLNVSEFRTESETGNKSAASSFCVMELSVGHKHSSSADVQNRTFLFNVCDNDGFSIRM
jgi:hypothetical protein